MSLLALIDLEATPAQMGLLGTMGTLPVLLLGLTAGAWVDRTRRRPLLVGADLGRFLLLLSVPALAWSGRLRMGHLYGVGFGMGALTLLFDVAQPAYLPALVPRSQLVAANSRLSGSSAVAEMAAPALGGLLVQLLSAPIAVLVDAGTFLLSAGAIWRSGRGIPAEATAPSSPANPDGGPLAGPVAGARFLARHPVLRPVAIAAALREFFGAFFAALYGLFVLRVLEMTPATLGLLVGAGGVGAFFGALAAGRLARRFGLGRSVALALIVSKPLALLLFAVRGPGAGAFAILLLLQLVGDFWLAIFFIGEVTLRQQLTPDAVLGRVNAAIQVLNGSAFIAGLLAAGLLGDALGIRPGILIGAVGGLVPAFVLMGSRIDG